MRLIRPVKQNFKKFLEYESYRSELRMNGFTWIILICLRQTKLKPETQKEYIGIHKGNSGQNFPPRPFIRISWIISKIEAVKSNIP